MVSVDVADGVPVTFDSYAKEDGSRKTEYGRYVKQDGKEIGFERVIRYDDGITIDQVMASGCLPVNFDYALLEVEIYNPDTNSILSVVVIALVLILLILLLIATSVNNTGKRYDTFGMADC